MKNPKIYKLRTETGVIPLDFQSAAINLIYEPLWSDGSFDGSYIPKMIGTIPNPPDCLVTLKNGEIIKFSRYTLTSENEVIIEPPYYFDNILKQ